MSALFFLLPLAAMLVTSAVVAFVWAARDGQLDDLETPQVRMLFDEAEPRLEPKFDE